MFTTATFVGYLVGGVVGALAATAGIFLPAFVLSGVVYALLPRIRHSPWAAAFLEGVTVCGLGLMAGVAVQFGRAAIVDVPTAAIAVIAFVCSDGSSRTRPGSCSAAPQPDCSSAASSGEASVGATIGHLGANTHG